MVNTIPSATENQRNTSSYFQNIHLQKKDITAIFFKCISTVINNISATNILTTAVSLLIVPWGNALTISGLVVTVLFVIKIFCDVYIRINAEEGNAQGVLFWSNLGGDIDYKHHHNFYLGPREQSPLMNAVNCQHLETITLLCDLGANLDYLSPWSKLTPLMSAAISGNNEIVQILIQKGANLDLCSSHENGITALVFACLKGHTEVVQSLVNAGASMNFRQANGTVIPLIEIMERRPRRYNQDICAILRNTQNNRNQNN